MFGFRTFGIHTLLPMALGSPVTFGDHIYALRTARGWSLRHAAKLAGLSHSRLSELESGRDTHTHKSINASYHQALKLARAYDVSPVEMLELAGHDPGGELLAEEWKLISLFRKLDADRRERLLHHADRLKDEAAEETWPLNVAEGRGEWNSG